MSGTFDDASRISVDVTNIGGISEASVEVAPGVTALVGPNATGRTSLVQAIAAALGTDYYSLKGDAQQGEVTLTVGDETYTRELHRENGHVATSGDPYLDDPDLAELYAVLLESNEVRRAVRHGGDLRELIMRPLDTEEISQRISELVARRRELDAELDRLDGRAETLADLQSERRKHSDRLEDIEAELDAKRAALEEADGADAATEAETTLEAKRQSLQTARTDLAEVERELEIERESLDSLRETRSTIEKELESVSAPDRERLATLEERLDGLRREKRTLESVIRELQGVIRFNRERLDGSESPLLDVLEDDTDPADVTADLDPAERTTTCWTCGSEVPRRSIDDMVDKLREIRQEKSAQRNRIESDIAELSEELDGLQKAHEQRAHLESRLDEVTENIDEREATIDRLEERRATLTDRVEDLEAEIESLQESRQDDLLELQAEVSELEFERDRVQERLADVRSDIEEVQRELAAREHLEARREAISADLQELRTRIDRIESEAVEAFNTHMDAIIDRLGYDNIDRIWIEPTQREVTDGRQRVSEEVFDLHVVRSSDAGAAYEDSLEHLSESERELVGLVVALAGYLVHDVHESVPFMLLDSLEMIDGQRLVELISYLEEFVPYLVVVLLPDHADAFESGRAPAHHRIVEI